MSLPGYPTSKKGVTLLKYDVHGSDNISIYRRHTSTTTTVLMTIVPVNLRYLVHTWFSSTTVTPCSGSEPSE